MSNAGDCVREPATTKTFVLWIQITAEPRPVLSPSATPGSPLMLTLLEVAYSTGTGMGRVVAGSPMERMAGASSGDRAGTDRVEASTWLARNLGDVSSGTADLT